MNIDVLDNKVREMHPGGQLFLQIDCQNLSDIVPHLVSRDQTLTVYGFSPSLLLEFSQTITHRTLDRIVPMGEVLNFNTVWDGYSLLQELTRERSISYEQFL